MGSDWDAAIDAVLDLFENEWGVQETMDAIRELKRGDKTPLTDILGKAFRQGAEWMACQSTVVPMESIATEANRLLAAGTLGVGDSAIEAAQRLRDSRKDGEGGA